MQSLSKAAAAAAGRTSSCLHLYSISLRQSSSKRNCLNRFLGFGGGIPGRFEQRSADCGTVAWTYTSSARPDGSWDDSNEPDRREEPAERSSDQVGDAAAVASTSTKVSVAYDNCDAHFLILLSLFTAPATEMQEEFLHVPWRGAIIWRVCLSSINTSLSDTIKTPLQIISGICYTSPSLISHGWHVFAAGDATLDICIHHPPAMDHPPWIGAGSRHGQVGSNRHAQPPASCNGA